MPASYSVAVLSVHPDRPDLPLINVEVEALDTALITPSIRLIHEAIVATARTNEAGVAAFAGIAGSQHIFRARTLEPHELYIISQQVAEGGIHQCYDAIVIAAGGGTDATLQAAINRLAATGGTILVCGMLNERPVIPANTLRLAIHGTSSEASGIWPTSGAGDVLTISDGCRGIYIKALNITATAAGNTGIRIHSAGVGACKDIQIEDVVFGPFDPGGGGGQIDKAIDTIFGVAFVDRLRVNRCRAYTSVASVNVFSLRAFGCEFSANMIQAVGANSAGVKFPVGGGSTQPSDVTIVGNFISTAGRCIEAALELSSITGNTLRSSAGEGIQLDIPDHVTVSGNDIFVPATKDGISTAGSQSAHALSIVGNAVQGGKVGIFIDTVGFTNIIIQGNSIKSTASHGIHARSGAFEDRSLVVMGNSVLDPGDMGIVVEWWGNVLGVGVAVTGNIVKDAVSHGIQLWSNGQVFNAFKNVTVVGNVVSQAGGDGLSLVATFLVAATHVQVAISGNTFSDCTGWGIKAGGANLVQDSLVVANVLWNNTAGNINNIVNAVNNCIVQLNV